MTIRPSRLVLVPTLCLAFAFPACGGPGPEAQSGSATISIVRPRQDQVVTVRSVAVEVRVAGLSTFHLRYFIDGADQGEGDSTFTITSLSPGNHRVEVEAFRADGTKLSPDLRAGVDFTIQ